MYFLAYPEPQADFEIGAAVCWRIQKNPHVGSTYYLPSRSCKPTCEGCRQETRADDRDALRQSGLQGQAPSLDKIGQSLQRPQFIGFWDLVALQRVPFS